MRYTLNITTNYPNDAEVYTTIPAIDREAVLEVVMHKLAMADISSWVLTVVHIDDDTSRRNK